MTVDRLRPQVFGSTLVLLFVICTRWPLAPKYLCYFDNVNFALALDDFNPALHQPQPPGYPLFVGLTRLIHLLVKTPEHVFLVTGIFCSAAAVLLLWNLGNRIFGSRTGLLAAVLLIFNPAFWLAGVTNQVRLFLALDGITVSLLAWRAVERSSAGAPLYAAFAATGIAAGFRPAAAVLLLPLLVWTWVRAHGRPRQLVTSLIVLAAAAAGWIVATGVASGGVASWLELLWTYSREQFRGSSAVFGAAAAVAAGMFWKAVVWNGLGALSWMWALPFNRDWRVDSGLRLRLEFLGVWFVPGFLFSAFIHIGDPDQALSTIPVLCLAGGLVLARFAESRPVIPLGCVLVAGMLLNAVIFFRPPFQMAWVSSGKAVRRLDRTVTSAIESIAGLRGNAPLAIVHYGSLPFWRQLQYYFPNESVFVVLANPANATSTDEAWLFRNRRPQPLERSGNEILVPAGSRIVCFVGDSRKWPEAVTPASGWTEHGPVIYSDSNPGGVFEIGGCRFRMAKADADPAARSR